MCLRAKDHLEGTKVAVFPRYCAPQKVQTGSAAAGGPRRVATRKTTGDLATRRGAGDPVRRAVWMTVSRCGHLRSAPVVVDACSRTEWEPPTLCASLSTSTRPAQAPPSWPAASPATRKRVCAGAGHAWLRVSRWCSMEEAKNRSRSSRDVQNRCCLLTGHQAVQVTAVSCLAERAAHVKVQPPRSRRHRDGLHAAT